jgi:hypothetical protein
MGFVNGQQFRLQIYDDGAGMYLFDAPLNSLLGAGSMDNVTGLPGGAVGPFLLPSPLAVTKPGLLTVQMSNVNTPLNSGNDQPNITIGYVALVFAVPKKCKGQLPQGGSEGFSNVKGVLG